MSAAIPEDAQRLSDRLRMLAEEVESAARYGVPIPGYVSVSDHEHGAIYVSADEHVFAAWVDYTEATVEHTHHHGADWSSAEVKVNGLPMRFTLRHEPVTA